MTFVTAITMEIPWSWIDPSQHLRVLERTFQKILQRWMVPSCPNIIRYRSFARNLYASSSLRGPCCISILPNAKSGCPKWSCGQPAAWHSVVSQLPMVW